MVVQRVWRGFALPLASWLAWLLTFVFVNVAWVFFRATSVRDASALLQGMVGMHGIATPRASPLEILLVITGLFIVLGGTTSNAIVEQRALTLRNAALAAVLLSAGFLSLSQTSPFIYFNF